MQYKIIEIINYISDRLNKIVNSPTEANQEAWWVLEYTTQKTRSQLLLEDSILLSDDEERVLENCLFDRVENKKPLQYILGFVPFCDLNIKVVPPILIPRPETEEWTIWLRELIKKKLGRNANLKILDLCSGSGCITLSLAKHLPNSFIIGTDVSDVAISLSLDNKKLNNIENATFIKSDLFEKIQDKKNSFDLIVSNPPYLSLEEYKNLGPEVKNWEDIKALIAPNEGYYFYEEIIKLAPNFLKPYESNELNIPQIVLELGYSQAEQVYKLFQLNNFTNIQIHKDLQSKDRFISANYIN